LNFLFKALINLNKDNFSNIEIIMNVMKVVFHNNHTEITYNEVHYIYVPIWR